MDLHGNRVAFILSYHGTNTEGPSGDIFFEGRSNFILTATGRGHKAYEPGTRGCHIEVHKPLL
jgi:hypothetical protein